jgi:hypothetical protein
VVVFESEGKKWCDENLKEGQQRGVTVRCVRMEAGRREWRPRICDLLLLLEYTADVPMEMSERWADHKPRGASHGKQAEREEVRVKGKGKDSESKTRGFRGCSGSHDIMRSGLGL